MIIHENFNISHDFLLCTIVSLVSFRSSYTRRAKRSRYSPPRYSSIRIFTRQLAPDCSLLIVRRHLRPMPSRAPPRLLGQGSVIYRRARGKYTSSPSPSRARDLLPPEPRILRMRHATLASLQRTCNSRGSRVHDGGLPRRRTLREMQR